MPEPQVFSNVVGFDDGPFPRYFQGKVPIVGTIYANERFDGMVFGHVRRDGDDAAAIITQLIAGSRFRDHIRLIMLQGIALAGFNVVDVPWLYETLRIPILVVARHQPNLNTIRNALTKEIPQGDAKWQIIEQLGPMEPVRQVFIQRMGLSREQAAATLKQFAIHSRIPEPLRAAHLIAGAIARGQSRGRP